MGLPVSVTRAQVRGQAEHETTGRGGDCGGPESRRPRAEGPLHPAGYCQGPTVPRCPSFSREAKKIQKIKHHHQQQNIPILMKTVGQTEPAGGPASHRAPSQAHSRRFSVFSRPIPHIHHSSLHRRRSLVPTLAPGRESRLKCSCTPRPPNRRSTRRSHLCLP